MSKATVELDLFGLDKENSSSKSQFQKFLDRRRSFRGIQNGISKIDPEILKSVIASGSASPSSENGNSVAAAAPNKSFSVPTSPKGNLNLLHSLPEYNPNSCRSASECHAGATPMTIFYNGSVSVFDLPRDKAEAILKLAFGGSSKSNSVESVDQGRVVPLGEKQQMLDSLKGDLPIARQKSLQKFLAKRKERLTSFSPYDCNL